MDDYERLSHSKWECKCHVVFIPKYRRRRFTGSCDNISGKCFASWRCKRKAESRPAEICGLAGDRIVEPIPELHALVGFSRPR